jgi:hypothetical protein
MPEISSALKPSALRSLRSDSPEEYETKSAHLENSPKNCGKKTHGKRLKNRVRFPNHFQEAPCRNCRVLCGDDDEAVRVAFHIIRNTDIGHSDFSGRVTEG